ncbi:hypothetical protein ACHAWF_002370 [Thalassiosira exigua]
MRAPPRSRPRSPSALHPALKKLALLSPLVLLCRAVHLDVHVPLPTGCVKYHALLANRLLRQASDSQPPPPSQSDGSKEGERAPSEEINLFSAHTPHVTLYLADFDLEEEGQEVNVSDADKSLNQTKVNAFLDAISSLNFTDVAAGLDCPLSLAEDTPASPRYAVVGPYTVLSVENTPCLRTLSAALFRALSSYLRRPVAVPSWVASLAEPERSAAIFRSRTYGSPNVLEGFEPHVTVGYDDVKLGIDANWRVDVMERWDEAYRAASETCADKVEGIALGKNGVGGTVLADSRMGYWDLGGKSKTEAPKGAKASG